MTFHILYTPMEEVRRQSVGERWCFACCKRREFAHVVSRPIVTSIDDTGAWYGPTHEIVCPVCKTVDGDCFPGTEREWSDA
jgi:hypothetical protein